MRKVGVFIIVGAIFLCGCVAVRTYTIEKPRIDRDIEGNRGYLYGSPSDDEKKESRLGDTRKVSVFEIEIGDSRKGKKVSKEFLQEAVVDEDVAMFSGDAQDEDIYIEEITIEEPKEEFEYYVVQKYDTLQKISKKFYGTSSKWKYLFNYNKDRIKNPDKVYPGTKIKVPVL